MRSVTSCFNSALYRKNLARFWPMWVGWTVLWAFVIPLNLLNEWRWHYVEPSDEQGLYRYYQRCLNLNGMLEEWGLLLAVVFGVLCAMAVFGYLFNHRSAATLHALPMRRETLFITNYLSGLTFILLPNLAVYLLAVAVELFTLPGYLAAAAVPCLVSGLLVKSGIELFFYSFAVFCAQFTGNILALPVFYAILNGLVVGMYTLVHALADNLLYGGWPLRYEPVWVKLLTPIYSLYDAAGWTYIPWGAIWDGTLERPISQPLELVFEDPAAVAGYAAAGLVLAGLALLVYRRRHIETAGDVVSVKVVHPIFRWGVAACAGLCGGLLITAFFGWIEEMLPMALCVMLCTAIGYIAAEMLLEKSFRVLKKCWAGTLTAVLVMGLVVVGLYADVLGVETWVPDPDRVEKATITVYGSYPYDDASYVNIVRETAAEKERITRIHRAILEDYKTRGSRYDWDDLANIQVEYTMHNGNTYSKSYYDVRILQEEINDPATAGGMLMELINEPLTVREAYDLGKAELGTPVCARMLNVLYPTGRLDMVQSVEGAREIWEAVQADFAAGNLGRRYLIDDTVRSSQTYRTDLQLRFYLPEQVLGPGYYINYEQGEVTYVEYEDNTGSVVVKPEATRDVNEDYVWNHSLTVTLTPDAKHTLSVLEKYFDLGGAYDIALHGE